LSANVVGVSGGGVGRRRESFSIVETIFSLQLIRRSAHEAAETAPSAKLFFLPNRQDLTMENASLN
jgi:hypothetical protein